MTTKPPRSFSVEKKSDRLYDVKPTYSFLQQIDKLWGASNTHNFAHLKHVRLPGSKTEANPNTQMYIPFGR